jgi:hypothetical protein
MTIAMRAGWRLVFLCLCSFVMPLKVVILIPSVINAAENRASIITISCNSTSLQQRRAQGQAEIDQAASLNRQAHQYQEQGRYEEAEPLYQRALAIEVSMKKDFQTIVIIPAIIAFDLLLFPALAAAQTADLITRVQLLIYISGNRSRRSTASAWQQEHFI